MNKREKYKTVYQWTEDVRYINVSGFKGNKYWNSNIDFSMKWDFVDFVCSSRTNVTVRVEPWTLQLLNLVTLYVTFQHLPSRSTHTIALCTPKIVCEFDLIQINVLGECGTLTQTKRHQPWTPSPTNLHWWLTQDEYSRPEAVGAGTPLPHHSTILPHYLLKRDQFPS